MLSKINLYRYIEDDDEAYGRGRKGKKWGGKGAGKGGADGLGGMNAIDALRAKMAGQLLASPSKKPKLEHETEERKKEREEEKQKAEDEAAAALEASAEKLEDEAQSWTDFQKACLHPKVRLYKLNAVNP